jgi:putative ABC transport system permease protein
MFVPDGAVQGEHHMMQVFHVDHDFIRTMKIKIHQGRDFSKKFRTDENHAFVINEAALKRLGWKLPLGKSLKWFTSIEQSVRGKIIGVVKDFHFSSLRDKIEPTVLMIRKKNYRYVMVKISGNTSMLLDALEQRWNHLSPHGTFEYFFLDDTFQKLYLAEQKLLQILLYFAFLAIVIACLGLFGLSSFSTRQRIKEIAIRKTLGASITSIIFLLSKEFLRWVIVANIIAWPIVYFVMEYWLQDFAYRTTIPLSIFIYTTIATLALSFFTVSFQSIKASLINPVQAMRYE